MWCAPWSLLTSECRSVFTFAQVILIGTLSLGVILMRLCFGRIYHNVALHICATYVYSQHWELQPSCTSNCLMRFPNKGWKYLHCSYMSLPVHVKLYNQSASVTIAVCFSMSCHKWNLRRILVMWREICVDLLWMMVHTTERVTNERVTTMQKFFCS